MDRFHTAILTAAIAGLSAASSAQSLTLEFRADRTQAAAGDMVHWEVWVYYDGYPDPRANFGGVVGAFIAEIPEIGLSMNYLNLMGNQALPPRPSGASVEDINIFTSCVLSCYYVYSGEMIYEFDVEIHEPFESLSYDVVGIASVFPDDGIFTLPEEYCRDPIQSTCDDPGFIVISDVVQIGHIPSPATEMVIEPDRPLVYRGDEIRWTASVGFPGWASVDSYAESFAGELIARGDPVGSARDPAGLLGGPFEAEADGLSVVGIAHGQPGGGTPDASNPIGLLSWSVGTSAAGTLSYAAEGEATLFNLDEGRVFGFGTLVTRATESEVVWAWPGPIETGEIEPPDTSLARSFGQSVAFDAGRLLVSDAYADVAHVLDAASGAEIARLVLPDGRGYSDAPVALAGRAALVGSPYDGTLGRHAGRAFLFDAGTGEPIATLAPEGVGDGDRFGSAVAIAGGVGLVGAPWGGADNTGAVFVFDLETGVLLGTIEPEAGSEVWRFGGSLAASGSLAVIGAPGSQTGSAFVYRLPEGDLLHELVPPDGAVSAFGRAVAIRHGTAVLATPETVNVFDADTGSFLYRPELAPATGSYDGIKSVAIADRAVLAVRGRSVLLFDRQTGEAFGSTRVLNYFGSSASMATDGDTLFIGDDESGRGCVGVWGVSLPCGRADLAAPWGVLDLADIVAFVRASLDERTAADITEPFGVWDTADLAAFIEGFAAGCP